VKEIIPRIIKGLMAIGLQPSHAGSTETPAASSPNTSVAESAFTLEEQAAGSAREEPVTPARWKADDADPSVGPRIEASTVDCKIVSEHHSIGFYADVFIPDDIEAAANWVSIRVAHQRLGPSARKISIQLPANNSDPILYLRLAKLIGEYPLVLRLHWLARLRSFIVPLLTSRQVPAAAVGVEWSQDKIMTVDNVGFMTRVGFWEVLPAGSSLPFTQTLKLRTTQDFQKRIVLTPAIRRADRVETFSKVRLTVMPAQAGTAWGQITYRIDPDGRFTVLARNPLRGMSIEDLWFQ
jgi:hypothetical protein